MQSLLRSFTILALFATSACSTVIEGTSQKITVNSSPQGAQCLLKQADDIVARITTPGTAEVSKTKNDLVILCSKEGYESTSTKNRSDLSIASLGNVAFYELSFVGNAVDAMSGASNKYDSKVFVELTPASAPGSFPIPPGAPVMAQLPMQSVTSMSMQAPMPGAIAITEPSASIAPVAAPLPSNPSIHASLDLAQAIKKLAEPQQMAQLSYAQEVAETQSRPPFGMIQ